MASWPFCFSAPEKPACPNSIKKENGFVKCKGQMDMEVPHTKAQNGGVIVLLPGPFEEKGELLYT
jgi:hypothetical protein